MGDKRKPVCEKCESSFTYVLSDGTVVCRNCGHRNKNPEEIKDNG